MNLLQQAVDRFNSLPVDSRTIAPNDVYVTEVVYYRPIANDLVGIFEGDHPPDVEESNAIYVGRAKYLWVGPRGRSLTATPSSFMLLAEEKAPVRRPDYMLDELVFNFPTFNGELTSRNGGNNLVFCPFKSIKGLVFDDNTKLSVTYNPHYTNSATGTGQLHLYLLWTMGTPIPVINEPEAPTILYVTIDLQTMHVWTSNGPELYDSFYNKDGLKGTFYWLWTSDNFTVVQNSQIHEMALTMTVLSPAHRFDISEGVLE